MSEGCSTWNLHSILDIWEISVDGIRCIPAALVESQSPEPVVCSNEVPDAVSEKIDP